MLTFSEFYGTDAVEQQHRHRARPTGDRPRLNPSNLTQTTGLRCETVKLQVSMGAHRVNSLNSIRYSAAPLKRFGEPGLTNECNQKIKITRDQNANEKSEVPETNEPN